MDTATNLPVVTPDAIRTQLERILAADVLANAGRLSRLLRYVVERTIAGDGAQLKEYVLGIDVFDRGDGFDPRLDSIVRVEVRRLRARLDEYYRGPGADDPVVITIPRGAYAPVFSPAVPTSSVVDITVDAAPAETPGHPTGPVHAFGWGAAAGFLVVALAALLVGAFVSRRATLPAEASRVPSIAVLPFQHYSTEASDVMTAARLTDGVTIELARLGTLSVVSRTTAAQYGDGLHTAREIAEALDADFVMESTVTMDGGRVTVVARLVSGSADRKVWVGEYDAPVVEIAELSRRIAAGAAAGVLKQGAAP